MARTPASASQLVSPNPPTLPHSLFGSRSDRRSSSHRLMAPVGSSIGWCRRLAALPTDHPNARSNRGGSWGRVNVRRSATPTTTTRTAASKARSATTSFPDSAPPATRTTIAPTHETRPPTNRHQLARDVGAPLCLEPTEGKGRPELGSSHGHRDRECIRGEDRGHHGAVAQPLPTSAQQPTLHEGEGRH